jgi:hypothetical protein
MIGRVRASDDVVTWDRFRDGAGESVDWPYPVDLAEIRFDRSQYLEELERAHADRRWEPPLRTAARRVREMLTSREPELRTRGFALDNTWASASTGVRTSVDGVSVALMQHATSGTQRQVVLGFVGDGADPEAMAQAIVLVVLESPVSAWPVSFPRGWRP